MSESSRRPVRSFLRSRYGLTLSVFILAAAFLLAVEHRAHIFAGSNWVLLAILGFCVGMHFFMHGGRGGGGNIKDG